MASEDPPPPQVVYHRATIAVQNCSKRQFKIQVLHSVHGSEFSGGHDLEDEDSGFVRISPNEQKEVLRITFITGFMYLGVDNWQLHGIELNENEEPIRTWKSGAGFGAKWKVHSLRTGDADKTTLIRVNEDLVEFISFSGTSSTSWGY